MPALVYLVGCPTHLAVGTDLFEVAISGLYGTASYAYKGRVELLAALIMPPKTFSTEALNYLTGYEWPGNIRQLENVVESCLVLVPGNVIDVDNLPAEIRDEESQFKSAVDLLPVQLDLADTLEKIEAALIRRALVRAELVQVKAAEYLGISKSLLQYKLKKYGITGH